MFQRKCFLVIFAAALPFIGSAAAFSQDGPPAGDGADDDAIGQAGPPPGYFAPSPEKQLEVARKAHENNLQRRLTIRIGELQRVCSLSEQQVKRLQLAAKGAVRYELKGFKQRFEQVQRQMMDEFLVEGELVEVEAGGVPAPVEPVASTPAKTPKADTRQADANPKKLKQDKEVAALLREVGTMYGPFGSMAASSDIEKQKFWLNALRKTLSEEQQTKHKQLLASRTAYRRRATVGHVVSGLDEKLLLSEPQRHKLADVVDTELGKFFEVLPHQRATYLLESLPHLRATRAAYSRVRKKAKAFLTDVQMEQLGRPPQADYDMFFGMAEDFFPPEPAVEIPEGAGFLGVQLVEGPGGVELQGVTEDLAADKAGLEVGDTIISFDGKDVSTVRELVQLVADSKAGQKVDVSIQRDDETLKIEVKLGERQ